MHGDGGTDPEIVGLTTSATRPVRAASPRHVLICEPQLRSYGLPYLPAMWGVLKTYWESHGSHPEMVRWHEPIHEMVEPEKIVAPLAEVPIDVLGLSCYTWNWRLQREIARMIKRSHPDCLIVAGGPHPDYRNPSFFEVNPFIDAVVVKDGEVPFTRILERTLGVERMSQLGPAVLSDIPGLCLPGSGGTLTAPPQVPDRYDTSAYLAQRPYYERFLRDHPQGVVAAWETSRGCPFRCTYCDWGSSTMSKVRRFDMDRLYSEIDWFAEQGVAVIFSVDSNFGMFKTDLDLTDAIVAAKETSGHPQYFIYSNAKNVPNRTIEITRKVVGAGLDTAHTLSIQHTSLDVLEATDRKNISVEKQIRVVRELQSEGIPISVQMIHGLPGDTPELWRKSFTDLMEWGIHDGHVITNYHLLPNAPAAEAAYREKWKIGTVDRYIYDGQGVRKNESVDPLTFARGEVIVETSSFSRENWVRMSVEAACLRGLHNAGVTQSIARYLRSTHGIGFASFYGAILEEFLPNWEPGQEMLATLTACYRQFLTDENRLLMLSIPGDADEKELCEPHRWLVASICRHAGEFFPRLAEFLGKQFPDATLIQSVCAYQHTILVLPGYDASTGKRERVEHDWPAYFQREDTVIPGPMIPEPEPLADGVLVVTDAGWDDKTGRCRYNWTPGEDPASWVRWFHTMMTNRLSAAKCNHQKIRVEATVPQRLIA